MRQCNNRNVSYPKAMSPREKHIPDDAMKTTIALTAEDRAAIQWISEVRRGKRDKRWGKNDILIDALWYFLDKTEGKTRDQIRTTIPAIPAEEHIQGKVTQMPKLKGT
jgi:hypothetical protein